MLLALILGLMLEPAGAEDPGSGLKLLTQCEKYLAADPSAPGVFDAASCAQYIIGFADATAAHGEPITGGVSPICFPKGVTPDQMIRVVVKSLKDHPEILHQHRALLVMASFAGAFPCPAKK